MKKMILLAAASVCLASTLFFTSCSRKHFATEPNTMVSSDTAFVPFTKNLKERLVHDGVDLKRVQFYTSEKLVLKHGSGTEKGQVRDGVVMLDYGSSSDQITIPAWTPGVCEKVDGDKLAISFDQPGQTLDFGALYENTSFILVGTNYHNGTVDVNYGKQPYIAQCASCGNAANVRLYIRKNQAYKTNEVNRVVMGRKVN